MMRTSDEEKLIEKAIILLVSWISESGHNPKPVILHSVKVGTYLYTSNYSTPIVVAGYLHNVVEDSEATLDEIREIFGQMVADLVAANSFNPQLENKIGQYQETFKRTVIAGKEALIVKAADILANLPYYRISDTEYEWSSFGNNKVNYFLKLAKPVIKNERVFSDLQLSYQKELNRI